MIWMYGNGLIRSSGGLALAVAYGYNGFPADFFR